MAVSLGKNNYQEGVTPLDLFRTLIAAYIVFGTVPFEVHRKRRGAISALFSKSQAIKEEPVIYNKVELLFKRLDEQIKRDGFAEMRMK